MRVPVLLLILMLLALRSVVAYPRPYIPRFIFPGDHPGVFSSIVFASQANSGARAALSAAPFSGVRRFY